MVATFTAPLHSATDACAALRSHGYAVLAPVDAAHICGLPLQAFAGFEAGWHDLPPDRYLRDGGHYRHRRHSCFVVDGCNVTLAPHRAHWQSQDYNALHGGMQRWFEPIAPQLVSLPGWTTMLRSLATCFSSIRPATPWFVEAHQFRIDTSDGIGRPTPEGAHRDGVDFVAVFMVARNGVKGGETRVFEAAGPNGQRFTLEQPWSLLLLDDTRVIHESTPIQPVGDAGYRDTLVLTYRANGFQGEEAAPATPS